MSVVSTIPACLDALVTRLQARPGLAGVEVTSGPLGIDDTAAESIQFDNVEADQDWASAIRRSRDETYTIRGFLWIVQPGADEPAIKAARDRAFELFDELALALHEDPTLGGVVRTAQVRRPRLDQGIWGDGSRAARIQFAIEVSARLTP